MLHSRGFGISVPPKLNQVVIYFSSKGKSEQQAMLFFTEFENKRWKNRRGHVYKNWKQLAWNYILEDIGKPL